jgi:16S rRNA (guanine527-N7)-methyltransferase
LSVSRATGARLAAVAEHHGLGGAQREQLARIVGELADDEHAPSSVRAGPEAVEVHVADSLSALQVPAVAGSNGIADIGSGAGFPGLPIAVALPSSHVWLVESQARRCAFLRRVCRMASIANADVVCARAERWADGLGASDAVLARALGPPPVVLEYAAPLLRIGGVLVDWRTDLDADATALASRAAGQLGLEPAGIKKVQPFEGASPRRLYLYLKVRATPERFPRRPGMARKRPLG